MDEIEYNFKINLINDSSLEIDVCYRNEKKESEILTTKLSATLDYSSLSSSLNKIKNPDVFPKLIDNLKEYRANFELTEDQMDLIDFTIKSIRRFNSNKYLLK